jgi:hypothetical protein
VLYSVSITEHCATATGETVGYETVVCVIVLQDPDTSWLAWYGTLTQEFSRNCQWRKKFEITVMNLRFLLLSWGFIKAVGQDRRDHDQTFIGVAKVVGVVVAAVGAFYLLVSRTEC